MTSDTYSNRIEPRLRPVADPPASAPDPKTPDLRSSPAEHPVPSPENACPAGETPAVSEADAPEPQAPEQRLEAALARIAGLETEAADFRDRWMRAEAEMANARARARREVEETRQYAVQKFAADIVEAAENLRRALDSLPRSEPGEPEIVVRLREGIAGAERNFLSVLERNGVRRDDPTGASFDPNLHQAMGEQESTTYPAGTVIQAWTPTWTLNGRLLRPAMVVVAKAPPNQPAEESHSPIGTQA
jgi:molecular chaperone GrpE